MFIYKRSAYKQYKCYKCERIIDKGDLHFHAESKPIRRYCYEHGQNMLKFSFVNLKHE